MIKKKENYRVVRRIDSMKNVVYIKYYLKKNPQIFPTDHNTLDRRAP